MLHFSRDRAANLAVIDVQRRVSLYNKTAHEGIVVSVVPRASHQWINIITPISPSWARISEKPELVFLRTRYNHAIIHHTARQKGGVKEAA
jgi:hypothetical protein